MKVNPDYLTRVSDETTSSETLNPCIFNNGTTTIWKPRAGCADSDCRPTSHILDSAEQGEPKSSEQRINHGQHANTQKAHSQRGTSEVHDDSFHTDHHRGGTAICCGRTRGPP